MLFLIIFCNSKLHFPVTKSQIFRTNWLWLANTFSLKNMLSRSDAVIPSKGIPQVPVDVKRILHDTKVNRPFNPESMVTVVPLWLFQSFMFCFAPDSFR